MSGAPMRQEGAYGIIADSGGRLVVLRAQSGRHYLPGGRLEPGESASEALTREIAEECGWRAEVGEQVASARQLILSGTVEVHATYWRAQLAAPIGTVTEHALLWLGPDEAQARLHRGGDRHAVQAYSAASASTSPAITRSRVKCSGVVSNARKAL